MPLLSDFDPGEIKEFKQDFSLFINCAFEIDRCVSDVCQDIPINVAIFKELVGNFKRKYPSLFIEMDINRLQCKPQIYFPASSLKDFFEAVVSRIEGITAVGSATVEQRQSFNRQKLNEEVSRIRDHMQVYYAGYHAHFSLLRFVKGKGANLVYSKDTVCDGTSPDFQICCYVALHQGYRKEIVLELKGFRYETAYSFGGIREPR